MVKEKVTTFNKRKASLKKYYENNIEKIRLHSKEYYYRNRAIVSKRTSERAQTLKRMVIDYYSKGLMNCVCCGESEYKFLTIDHINNDGRLHRKTTGKGHSYYSWFIKNNFPSGHQILCYNCNNAKQYHKICPHQEIKMLDISIKEELK